MAKTKLDDETTAALTLFNEYVAADRERTQREKRLKKAERAKDDAAALVKKLSKRASSKERSEAEDAYRAAADKWQALRDGKEPPPDPEAAGTDEPEDATSDEPEADTGAETTAAAEAETEAAEAETNAEAETPAEAETEAADQAEAEAAASDRAEAEPGAAADREPEAQAGAEGDEVESESDNESGPSEKPTG